MPAEDTSTSPSGLDVNKLLREHEAPLSPDYMQWRVTNTTNDKKRGQVVLYADPRASRGGLVCGLGPSPTDLAAGGAEPARASTANCGTNA
jgi:hypothetical protein